MIKKPIKIKTIEKFNSKNAILIVGFPGIGNIAKIVANLSVEHMKMKEIYRIYSPFMPANVIIGKNEIAEKPYWSIYGKKINHKKFSTLLVFTGIMQIEDAFVTNLIMEELFKLFKKLDVKKIITAAGIGLDVIKENFELYITANNEKELNFVKKKLKINTKIAGYVSQINGMNGVILQAPIPAVSFVIETYAMPFYFGLKEAREVIKAINKAYNLKLPLKVLDEEIKKLEKEVKVLKDLERAKEEAQKKDINYIG